MKSFSGAGDTDDVTSAVAGDIVGLAGFDDVDIGDTLAASKEADALPFVEIDPATVQMEFSVNNGPLGGKDGKKVTSRASSGRPNPTSPLVSRILTMAHASSSTHVVPCRSPCL